MLVIGEDFPFIFLCTLKVHTHGTKGTVADIAYYENISWNYLNTFFPQSHANGINVILLLGDLEYTIYSIGTSGRR